MFHTLMNALFGCSHRRTTFPLTARRVNGASHPGTYVVCLDCGTEFDYNWDEMRIGPPVPDRVPTGARQLSPANR